MPTPMPAGYSTINPFIITREATTLISFLKEVFGATEVQEAHTVDTDGLLLHSELKIGDSTLMVADTKEGWPFTPSLLQIYVEDLEQTLKQAEQLGARVVTQPTEVYGDLFSRLVDPCDNLWWVYQYMGDATWEETSAEEGDDLAWNTESSELQYIHDTLLETMANLGNTN